MDEESTIITSHSFTPFVPINDVLEKSGLPDRVMSLVSADGKFGHLSPVTIKTISQYMAVINSYYSNLIEGNYTHPRDIRAAQRGEYKKDPVKRDLQKESLAHIYVQEWIKQQTLSLDKIYSPEFIKDIHREFYNQIPEDMWYMKEDGNIVDKVKPGQWRERDVEVGKHVAPGYSHMTSLMKEFCNIYHPDRYVGHNKIISVMCAHHRFAWIHPFIDGNGRVVRLFTDTALSELGLNGIGVWCLSRGLARTSKKYKSKLARADLPRQSMDDGRGLLSQNNLMEMCEYMLDMAIDQVTYMSDLLTLNKMKERIKSYIQARNDKRVPTMEKELKKEAYIVLYHAFANGELKRADAYEICPLPERTARDLFRQLREEGLLTETSPKSPLKWAIPEHAESWYFPKLVPDKE